MPDREQRGVESPAGEGLCGIGPVDDHEFGDPADDAQRRAQLDTIDHERAVAVGEEPMLVAEGPEWPSHLLVDERVGR